MPRRFPGLAALPRRSMIVGASVLATGVLAGLAYFALQPGGAETWYASFLVQEGERAWEPVDIDRSVQKIEAFQELENKGLQNMLLELDQDPHSAPPTEAELERLWTLYEASWRAAE